MLFLVWDKGKAPPNLGCHPMDVAKNVSIFCLETFAKMCNCFIQKGYSAKGSDNKDFLNS